MTETNSPQPSISQSPSALWWMITDLIWAGPGRWLTGAALPMRGLVAAGGDPVMPDALPPDARTLEFMGMIMPGLQDAHVHSGLIDLKAVRAGGIAAVTDLGGVPAQVAALREQSYAPASELPLLDFVGAFLTTPGGYPSDRSWAAPGSCREVHSVADAEQAVAEQVAHGVQAIKVVINVDAGPVLEPSVLAAEVTAAHAAGLRVVAHAEGAGAVRMALSGGVDVLAHTPWTEELALDLARECARQTVWISSLSIHRRFSTARQVAMYNLCDFLDEGGVVRYGTDLGNGKQWLGVNSEEILTLQTVGLTVDEVLDAMTGPMLGVANASADATSSSSTFISGVSPCQLVNPFRVDEPVVGPLLRNARLLSVGDVQEMERWLT